MNKLGKFIFALMLFVAPAQASVLLSEADFVSALQKEFVEQGNDEKLELEFFGGQTSFVMNEATDAKIMISQLKTDDEQNRFSAKAEIFADGNLQETTNLTGRFFVLGDIYVPVRDIDKNEIISQEMLEQKAIRMNRVKEGSVIILEKLIGQQARKKIKAGKIINEREIGDVIIVKKGTLLTSVYRSKGLQITAQAMALEDGAKGQNIEVENTKSKKKFMAKVVGEDMVEIVTE
ncbi:MAG: flagellar basal body P-ring formation protein FlgA [Alphaproteobacteria bacterium]|nr:flagellar basal body P-ring formation protein FlgA [Alphaproteobacteria bacterium]